MKKSDIKRSKILEFLTQNPGSSSTQIAEFLGVHVVTAHAYLSELVHSGHLIKEGNSRSTRYFGKRENIFPFDTTEIENKVKEQVGELAVLGDRNLADVLEKYILIHLPDGTFRSGYSGVLEILTKERQGRQPNKEQYVDGVCDFLFSLDDMESRRRKNGFFNGTQSLREIMKKYQKAVGIDQLIFCEVMSLGSRWKLRTGIELRIAKETSNATYYERSILPSIPKIVSLMHRNYDALILTPPTRDRKLQFRDFLREKLERTYPKRHIRETEIMTEKIQEVTRIIPEQKSLRGYARITNADASVSVRAPENLKAMKHIIIFDDSFTTGATINAIALKLRSQGYTGKITAITITGNFFYEPGVTDVGEV